MKIFVTVKTRVKKPKITKLDESHFKAAVKEAPEKGKANQAVIEALASFFNLPKSNLKIVSGLASKKKVIEIGNKI